MNVELNEAETQAAKEHNSKRCKDYYEKKKKSLQRARVLKRLDEGKTVRKGTLEKYGLEEEASVIENKSFSEKWNAIFCKQMERQLSETSLSHKTKKTYISRINQVNKLIPKNRTFVDFMTDFNAFISTLKIRYGRDYASYIVPFITASHHDESPLKTWYVTHKTEIDAIMEEARLEKMNRQEAAVADCPTLSWHRIEDFIAYINQRDDDSQPSPLKCHYLAKPIFASQEHLLFNLLYINTIRDDYGNIKLFRSTNDNKEIEALCLPHNAGVIGGRKRSEEIQNIQLPDQTSNWFDLATMSLHLQDYKNYKHYGIASRVMPSNIVKLIIASLKQHPRAYLIELKNQNGHLKKLSSIIPKLFRKYMGAELSINDLRHSKIAYFHSMPNLEFKRGTHKEALAHQMLHSLETAILIYNRAQIYDIVVTKLDSRNKSHYTGDNYSSSDQGSSSDIESDDTNIEDDSASDSDT